jgi:uncharacterized SAM-binding protein YcdF (DUF218 family)
VIFGAAVHPGGRASETMRWRVAAARVFATRLRDPLFVPTGGIGRFGPAEAVVMAALLKADGVSEHSILLEPTGTDTLSSARAVAALLDRRGIAAPVFVATSRYHLPRCLILLRLLGIQAHAAMPPAVPAARAWWRRCFWWLRELPALFYDVGLALYWRRRRR